MKIVAVFLLSETEMLLSEHLGTAHVQVYRVTGDIQCMPKPCAIIRYCACHYATAALGIT